MAAKINENDLAKAVTALEGGKVNLPIGQVKEVIRCLKERLQQEEASSILCWLGK